MKNEGTFSSPCCEGGRVTPPSRSTAEWFPNPDCDFELEVPGELARRDLTPKSDKYIFLFTQIHFTIRTNNYTPLIKVKRFIFTPYLFRVNHIPVDWDLSATAK